MPDERRMEFQMKIVIIIDDEEPSEFSGYENAIEALRMCARFHKPNSQDDVEEAQEEQLPNEFENTKRKISETKETAGQILDNLVSLKPEVDRFTKKQKGFYSRLAERSQKMVVILAQNEILSEHSLSLAFPMRSIKRTITYVNQQSREKLGYELIKVLGSNQNQVRRYELDDDFRQIMLNQVLAPEICQFLDEFVGRYNLQKEMGKVEIE